jgi:HK97 family phage prohead protease
MPEETDKYIRIPVAECDITATIDISEDEGIKALYCGKEKKIATYLFLKEKGWTMAKAKKWVKEHKDEEKNFLEDTEIASLPVAPRNDNLMEGNDMEKRETFNCECLDCGYKFESEEHCNEVKCPECGGKCRRVERPGPGQKSAREERSYQVEMRVEDGDKPKIRGHAAVFDKLSVPLMGFREKVSPGAFSKSIKKSDIRALWNHNPDYVLGRNKSGTLTLEEDNKGLAIEISPPDTQWARDLMETIRRGDVDQMSFAFQVAKDSWDESGKESVRTLEEVDLFDVSPVTYPAYPQTDVKVRSFLENAGLDVDRLAVVMERKMATDDEDITVVRQAIDILNSCLPEQAENLGGQGAPNEGYAERLKVKREKWEFGSN